jgi:hypothetical protein
VSLFVQRLRTETVLRSTTGRSTKKPSTVNDICYFIFNGIIKKVGHELPVDISTPRI